MKARRAIYALSGERFQAGFALIAGLMVLVVMSLIGVTMMNVTRLETMMAGGAREANIAFQATEAGLRAGEAAIEATATIGAFLDNGPLLNKDVGAEPDFFETDDGDADYAWDDDASAEYSVDPNCPAAASCYPEVAKQPRFVAKHVDDMVDTTSEKQAISIGGYGQSKPPEVAVFRVTSRGISRDSSAEALLQSYYGKIY